jgi:hypothetical protein
VSGAAPAGADGPAGLAARFAGARWRDVVTRRQALPALPDHVLLHAGPAFEGAPPAPVLNAAAQALCFEGLATTAGEAATLIESGRAVLMPAQDAWVATPLAQVVSASMPLAVVGGGRRIFLAPLVEGTPPALRFGSADPACLGRMAAIAALGLDVIAPLLRAHPVGLDVVIERALATGDECHGRTAAANEALLAAIDGLPASAVALLAANPNFVLPVLMAAAGWLLAGGDGEPQPGAIEAVGGNGVQFGFRTHGAGEWTRVAALPPVGGRLPGREAATPLGAIGDSAVIDFCGLGGQAMHLAPLLAAEWAAWMQGDPLARRQAVVDPRTGLVDLDRIAAGGTVPQVNLAILDRDGAAGLLGRGFSLPPATLFGLPG